MAPPRATLLSLVITVALLSPRAAAGQGMTGQQADEILKELKALRDSIELLLKRSAPPAAQLPRAADDRVRIPDRAGLSLGSPDAPVTIVEFMDLHCAFCRQFARGTFEEIKRAYVDTGQVRFVTRDLPLTRLHPQAHRAAVAARCAGEQNAFWEMRKRLLAREPDLPAEALRSLAEALALDVPAFEGCLSSGRFAAAIQQDAADAALAGITGTPSFIIGRSDGEWMEGVKVVGAHPFTIFDAKVKQVLAETAGPPPPRPPR